MNIIEIKQLIEAADICGHVPLIKGVHGIGKSESANQYTKEQNMHFEPLILSLMDTGDLLGLPVEKVVGGISSTIWAAPSWYSNIINAAWPEHMAIESLKFNDEELEEYFHANVTEKLKVGRGELNSIYCDYYRLPDDCLQLARQSNVEFLDARRSLLFLDEFNRANQDILNASLQLILDHRLHSHVLPIVRGQETCIVAAVNPAGDDYTVQEFDPALLDRFIDCELDPDLSSWRKWAKANNVNKMVMDFLADNKSKFHFTPKDGSKGASPRSWTRLANYMDKLESTPKDIMIHYIKGTVGTSLAAQFIHFYNNYGAMTSVEDIEKLINGEVKKALRRKVKLNPETIAKTVEKVICKLDVTVRAEFAEILLNKYVGEEKFEDAMPMLVFMYSLPLENLSAALKSMQSEDIEQYAKLVGLDREANAKGLFRKIVSHAKAV